MLGRTDLAERYGNSVETMLNFIATPQGPAIRRSGTRFVAEVQDSSKKSRLIPFVFSTTQAYILEFGHQKIRIFRNEGIVLAPDNSVLHINVDPDLDEWKVKEGHGYVDQQGPFRLTTTASDLPDPLALATNYFITLPHSITFANGDVDTASNEIDLGSGTHGYRSSTNRQGPFRLTTNMSLPTGMDTETDVYVERVDANEIKLHDAVTGGSQITWSALIGVTITSVNAALDTLNIDDHGFTDQFGPIELETTGADLPNGLTVATPYFVILKDKDNFQLSLTAGGTAETFSDAGTGTHTISGTHTLTPTPTYKRQSFALSTAATGIASIVTQTDTGTGTHTITNYDADSDGDGDLALEVDTTYQESELPDIHFGQSADVLYIAHPSHRVRKLSRFSDTVWTLDNVKFLDGPYLGVSQSEITEGTTFAPAAASGNKINLVASAAMFVPSDIGRLVRILHSTTYGWAEITGFQSNLIVDIAILSVFAASTAVTDWQMGRWGNNTNLGHPRNVSFFEQRLSFSSNPGASQTFYSSVTADFENFAPTDVSSTVGVTDDSAVQYTMNSNRINSIRWMSPMRSLVLGTGGGIWPVQSTQFLDPITPTNVLIKRSSYFGTSSVSPAVIEDLIIYSSASGRQVRAIGYDIDRDSYLSKNLTDFAEHIVLSAVTEITYSQEPHSVIWTVQTDGVLAGCTLVTAQNVLGWHRHVIGGTFGSGSAVVESAVSIPTQTEDHDQLWVIVKRTINSTTKRYVEFMEEPFEDGDALSDGFFVDSGLTATGVTTNPISGLDHLEGEIVQVLGDGAPQTDKTVVSGAITIDTVTTTSLHVGLGYNSDIKTLRIDAPDQSGTTQGKTKAINEVMLRVDNTVGGKIGPTSSSLTPLLFGYSVMDSAPDLFTGDKTVQFDGGYDEDAQIFIRQDQPLPMTLVALAPEVSIGD